MVFEMEVVEVTYRQYECFVTVGTAKHMGIRDQFQFRMYHNDRAFKRYKPGDKYLLRLEKRTDEDQTVKPV